MSARPRPRHRRLPWLCTLVAALAAAMATPALAAPGDRATAVAAFNAEQQDEKVPAAWTGAVSGCVVGTESAESLGATLRAVNRLRDFAGLAPVTFDPQLSQKALAAALMMKAANALAHDPGPTWPCFSAAGADGAGHSNLYLGRSGAAAMVGYVKDDGVASLGHRRWALDAAATVFGSGSTGTSNALFVVSPATNTAVPPDRVVAWPPAGWVPWTWIAPDWSVSVGAPGQAVAFTAAQVTMTVDGTPVTVNGVTGLAGGFGSGETLSWRPELDAGLRSADHLVRVTITGVTVDGRAVPISFAVSAFAPAPVAPGSPGAGGGTGTGTGGRTGTGGQPTARPRVRFARAPVIRRRGHHGALLVVTAPLPVGALLSASTSVAGGRVTAYRWRRDGKAIFAAVRASYRVTAADRGHRLSVRVTATTTGARTTVQRTSLSVPVGARR